MPVGRTHLNATIVRGIATPLIRRTLAATCSVRANRIHARRHVLPRRVRAAGLNLRCAIGPTLTRARLTRIQAHPVAARAARALQRIVPRPALVAGSNRAAPLALHAAWRAITGAFTVSADLPSAANRVAPLTVRVAGAHGVGAFATSTTWIAFAGALPVATHASQARDRIAPESSQIATPHGVLVLATRRARLAYAGAITEEATLSITGFGPPPLPGCVAGLITGEPAAALRSGLAHAATSGIDTRVWTRRRSFPVARRIAHRDAFVGAPLQTRCTLSRAIRVLADKRANPLRDELSVPTRHYVLAVALLRAFDATTRASTRRAQ
jgi:hypothetical protein